MEFSRQSGAPAALFRIAIANLALCLVPSFASAAVVWDWDGSILSGADGVNVNGTIYNVDFVDGTCAEVFGGCDELSDFDFNSEADALVAAQALLDQVFLDLGINGSPANFDTVPALTNGCGSETNCRTIIPYDLINNIGWNPAAGAANWAPDLISDNAFSTSLSPSGTASISHLVYGVFTPVPIPPALWLFCSGLLGLIGIARKKAA